MSEFGRRILNPGFQNRKEEMEISQNMKEKNAEYIRWNRDT